MRRLVGIALEIAESIEKSWGAVRPEVCMWAGMYGKTFDELRAAYAHRLEVIAAGGPRPRSHESPERIRQQMDHFAAIKCAMDEIAQGQATSKNVAVLRGSAEALQRMWAEKKKSKEPAPAPATPPPAPSESLAPADPRVKRIAELRAMGFTADRAESIVSMDEQLAQARATEQRKRELKELAELHVKAGDADGARVVLEELARLVAPEVAKMQASTSAKRNTGRQEISPFERAICVWILQLPGIWTRLDWSQVTQTQDAALDRLVKGGFVEARLSVAIHVKGEAGPINTRWRVSGDYGPVLPPKVLEYLVAHGHEGKETRIETGEYEEVRLTTEGELAQQDFHKPQLDYGIFSLVAGGPDGRGGVTPSGTAYFEPDRPVTPHTSGQASQAEDSGSTAGPQEAVAIREAHEQIGKDAVMMPEKPGQPDMIDTAKWQSIAEIEDRIKKLGPTGRSILLLGETGTGKDFYAEKISKASSRKKPLVVVNCPEQLKGHITSSLFGHVKGAFTDAKENRSGLIREAVGGTVFLDEIGDLPEDCWANLYRFLEKKEICPFGGQTTIVVDVRILAATNRSDRIPEPAWHRFNEQIWLPPLRTRRGDIPALAKGFFKSAKANMPNYKSLRFRKAELGKLGQADYHWPGNVRQLKNAIERAMTRHKGGLNLAAEEVMKAAKEGEKRGTP